MSSEQNKYEITDTAHEFLKNRFGNELGNEIWHSLEAFSVKRLKQIDDNAEFAAVIFDGQGGEVTGLDLCLNSDEDYIDDFEVHPDISDDQAVECMVSLEVIHDLCVAALQQGKYADCVKDVMEIATKTLRCDN